MIAFVLFALCVALMISMMYACVVVLFSAVIVDAIIEVIVRCGLAVLCAEAIALCSDAL
jgi:hypothetical protein